QPQQAGKDGLPWVGRCVERERQNAAVSQATPPTSALPPRLFQHDRRRPMHVVKRQACIRQRTLPSRPSIGGLLVRFALNGLGEICLCGTELNVPCAALVARKPLLQRRLYRPL